MEEFKPDFKTAYCMANDILIQSHTIETIPFDVRKYLREETDIALRKYRTTRRKYGIAVPDLGSDDALIVEMGGKYIIFYDELAYPPRMVWSIVHEMGHFYLNHNLDFKNISPELYEKQEIEANFFAAQLLMPDQIIWELVERYQLDISASFLQERFKVSNDAAEKRIETLCRQFDYKHTYPAEKDKDLIILKFGSFINSLKPSGYYKYSSFDEEEEMQKERDSWISRRRCH
ncbi:MAG: ImmA/IrrE family metallo-endopeptidase [Erysipelotrichaceae bacterium]|nr:ImmA/IrrE family metallo-endopeptidase [Erysipelotrichaceae bacterium]